MYFIGRIFILWKTPLGNAELETDEYTLDLHDNTRFTVRAKVKFVKYGSHGALSALISINSIEHYVTGTLEKIRVPSKKKIYFITGIEMYGNAVRLNFIDGNALWKENVFLFR